MNTPELPEMLAQLNDDERAEAVAAFSGILDELPAIADDPLDAGLRDSIRTVIGVLSPTA